MKGKQVNQYEISIQQGISLHKFIDKKTDSNPLFIEACSIFKPDFHISSGIFIDIFFDYFLANHADYFNEKSLNLFTQKVYTQLMNRQDLFNERMKTFFNYMKEYNWLYHYRELSGIERTVMGICKRIPRLGDGTKALKLFHKHQKTLNDLFNEFFPVLENDTKNYLLERNLLHFR